MPKPNDVVRITFEIPDEHAPAFRAAVDDFSSRLGTRIEQNIAKYDSEEDWTHAIAGIGALRAATTKAIPQASQRTARYV